MRKQGQNVTRTQAPAIMSSTAKTPQAAAKKSKFPLILALLLALAGGGGGFALMYFGLLDSVFGADHGANAGSGSPDQTGHATTPATPNPAQVSSSPVTFVALEPITVNLGPRGESRHLRFSAQVEVPPAHAEEVRRLMPRILDVLNIYLRALDPHELEEPAALLRLRGQMLRRVQIVTGPGFINDLLVTEFVFN